MHLHPRHEDVYLTSVAQLGAGVQYGGGAGCYPESKCFLHAAATTQRAHHARKEGIADEPYLVISRELVELFDRRYQAALDVLSSVAPEVFQDQNRFVPRTELYAEVYGLMGNRELARVRLIPSAWNRKSHDASARKSDLTLAGVSESGPSSS